MPEEYRDEVPLDILYNSVKLGINFADIDGVIISTEPKAHKVYALWAIKHGWPTFIDKPLSAFTSRLYMDTLYKDYLEVLECLNKNKVNVVMCCQRRGHLGYKFIKEYVANMIKQFGIPITFLDIHYGDGLWNMPDEYFSRENHPYKYGYGVLLHSGHHYVDLLMDLLSLNNPIEPLSVDYCNFNVLTTTPYNSLNKMQGDIYSKLLKTDRFEQYLTPESINKMRYFGEIDF